MEIQRLQEEIQILSKLKRSRESSHEKYVNHLQTTPESNRILLKTDLQSESKSGLLEYKSHQGKDNQIQIDISNNLDQSNTIQILHKQIQFLELQKEKHIQKYIEDVNFYKKQLEQLTFKLEKEKKNNQQNKEIIKQNQKLMSENEKYLLENKQLKKVILQNKEILDQKRNKDLLIQEVKQLKVRLQLFEKSASQERSRSLKKSVEKHKVTSVEKQAKELKNVNQLDKYFMNEIKKTEMVVDSKVNSCLSSIYQKSDLCDLSDINSYQDDLSNQICNQERKLFSLKQDYQYSLQQQDRVKLNMLASEVKKAMENLLSLKQKQKESILNSFTK